jgi:hypothetical protein
LTPNEHPSHRQLTQRASCLVPLAKSAETTNAFCLLVQTVRAHQVNKRRPGLNIYSG